MDDTYISVDDAATELQVSRGTLWKWIRRIEVPTFRFLGERRTFLRREDVEQLRQPIPAGYAKKLAA